MGKYLNRLENEFNKDKKRSPVFRDNPVRPVLQDPKPKNYRPNERMLYGEIPDDPYKPLKFDQPDYQQKREALKVKAETNNQVSERIKQLREATAKAPTTKVGMVQFNRDMVELRALEQKQKKLDPIVEPANIPPSVDKLDIKLENIKKNLKSGSEGFIYNMAEGWMQGQVEDWISTEYYRKMLGLPNQVDKIENFLKDNPDLQPSYKWQESKNWIKEATRGLTKLTPMIINGSKEGVGQAGILAAGFAGTAALAGQAGVQVIVPEEVVTVPGAAILGFQMGMSKGIADYVSRQEAGSAYVQYVESGIDPEIARPLAETVGAFNGILEVSQIGTVAKSVPGVKDFIQNASKKITKEAAKKLGRIAASYGSEVAENAIEEVIQEAATISGGELGKLIHQGKTGEQLKRMTFKEIASDLLQTGLQAAIDFSLMPLGGVAKDLGSFSMDQAKAASFKKQQLKTEASFKKAIFEDIPGSINEFKENIDTLQEKDAISMIALEQQLDNVLKRKEELKEEYRKQILEVKGEIGSVIDTVIDTAKEQAPELKFADPKDRSGMIADIIAGKVDTDLNELVIDDFKTAQKAKVVDQIVEMLQEGKDTYEIGEAIQEKLPKSKRKPEIISAVVQAVSKMVTEADSEILVQKIRNVQTAMKIMPQNQPVTAAEIENNENTPETLQNAPGQNEGIITPPKGKTEPVAKTEKQDKAQDKKGQATKEESQKAAEKSGKETDNKTELSTEEYKKRLLSTDYMKNLVESVDKTKIHNEKAAKTNPVYKRFKDVVTAVQNNPVFNGLTFKFIDEDTKRFWKRSELDEAGYQNLPEGWYEIAGQQEGNTNTGRTITLYRNSTKDTITEELIHDLQKRIYEIDPELEDLILAWEENVHAQALNSHIFNIPDGYETFAQALVFSELGYADANPDLAELFSIPEEIMDRVNAILGEELLQQITGTKKPQLKKKVRILDGKSKEPNNNVDPFDPENYDHVEVKKAIERAHEVDFRLASKVGKRGTKAIIDLYPEFKPFYEKMAAELLADLNLTVKADLSVYQQENHGDKIVAGNKRITSSSIARILDSFKVTYDDLQKALESMAEGKVTTALQRRIELVIDDNLTLGYENFYGDKVPANEQYLELKYGKQGREATMQLKPTQDPKFMKWFEGSKVVNSDGSPMVVYHGTPNTEFSTFKPSKDGRWGKGIYFYADYEKAKGHAGENGRVIEVYLSIKNPLIFPGGDKPNADVDADGVFVKSHGIWIANKSSQVKSIFNSGSWDPDNPNINYQLKPVKDLNEGNPFNEIDLYDYDLFDPLRDEYEAKQKVWLANLIESHTVIEFKRIGMDEYSMIVHPSTKGATYQVTESYKDVPWNASQHEDVASVVNYLMGSRYNQVASVAEPSYQLKPVEGESEVDGEDLAFIKKYMSAKDVEDALERFYNANRSNYDSKQEFEEQPSSWIGDSLDSDWKIHDKYMSKIQEDADEAGLYITWDDIIRAYRQGKLDKTREKKAYKPNAINIQDIPVQDMEGFWVPKKYEGNDPKEVYVTASMRMSKSNEQKVLAARKELFMLYHTDRDLHNKIGITRSELNKKVKQYTGFTQAALDAQNRLNGSVPDQFKWAGITNLSWINKQSITPENVDMFIDGLQVRNDGRGFYGDSGEWLRRHIINTFLGIDTRISYDDLKFEVGKTVSPRALGEYIAKENKIIIDDLNENTVTHEIGHYLDHKFAKELDLTGALSDSSSYNWPYIQERGNYLDEQIAWAQSFLDFVSELTDKQDTYNEYTQRRGETFARFTAKFVQWANEIAGNQSFDRHLSYQDKFSTIDYINFIQLLQQKAYVDALVADRNKSYQLKPVDTFYSSLQRVIDQKMPRRATADQVMGIVKNNGIKADEIKWSGIQDYLEGKDQVDKEELLQYLKDHDIKIEEVLRSDNPVYPPEIMASLDQWTNTITQSRERLAEIYQKIKAEEVPFDILYSDDDNKLNIAVRRITNGTPYEQEVKTLIQDATLANSNISVQRIANTPKPKYGKYKLPGGSEYREILFTFSNNKYDLVQNGKVTKTFPNIDEAREAMLALPQEEKPGTFIKPQVPPKDHYKSSHWDESDVLAHTRLQDFYDVNGKKILMIEEIQSDWHQAGRRSGYRTSSMLKLGKSYDDLKEQIIDIDADYIQHRQSGMLTEEFEKQYKEQRASLAAERERIGQELQAIGYSPEGLPDAPFPKTWHEFILKRMIRYAADHGYDGIAWTTGEQQNDRYKLSKYIDELMAFKRDNGMYWLMGKKDGEGVFNDPEVAAEKLPDVIGKEMAQKILNGENVDTKYNPFNGYESKQVFSGVDLEIGGQGMKGFYDKIIPDFLKKYLKRWGIGLEDMKLGTSPVYAGTRYEVVGDEGYYTVIDTDTEESVFTTRDREEAYTYLDNLENEPKADGFTFNQPGFYLNDEMKNSAVYEGQPLYQIKPVDYDFERRSFYSTVEMNPITDPKLRAELQEIAGLYKVKHNEDTLNEALKMLYDMGTEAAKTWIMGSEPATAEMNVVAQLLVKQAMDHKNYDTAIELIDATAKKATEQGQAIQVLSLFGTMTPEGIVRYTRKSYQKLLTDGQVNEVNNVADQMEKDLREVNKKAAEDLDTTEGIKEIAEKTPEELLARKIFNSLKEKGEKEYNPVKIMVDTLFKVYKETVGITKEKPIDNTLTFIAEAITKREEYREVWNVARAIVRDELKDDPNVDAFLEEYYDLILMQTFPDSMLQKAVRTGIKDLQIKIDQVVKKHYSEVNKTTDSLAQKLVRDAGLNGYEALALEDYIQKAMSKITAEAKERILKRTFKDKNLTTRERKTLANRIIEMSNLGGLKSATYKGLVAAKLGFPALTEEMINSLDYQAQKIQEMPEGHEKDVAVAKMLDTVAAGVPVNFSRKISTLQTMAQLLNPKTIIRNLVGNTAFQGIDRISRVVMIPLDVFASWLTKTRTKTFIGITPLKDREGSIAQKFGGYLADILLGEGFREGWDLGLQDALAGVDTSGLATQYELPMHRTFRAKEWNLKNGLNNVAAEAETLMNIALRVTDRAAFMASFTESLNEQMKIAKATEATEEMVEIATAYGLYRTFQDANKVSNFFVTAKRWLNVIGTPEFGLGDLILKYPKTPGNLLARAIDYSPLGVMSVAFKLFFDTTGKDINGKPKTVYRAPGSWKHESAATKAMMQRAAVEGIGRAITGTALITAGLVLAKLGVITGGGDDDWDIYYMNQLAGLDKYQVNISALLRYISSGFNPDAAARQEGDMLASYDWFQPFSTSLAVGADLALNINDEVGFLGSIVAAVEVGSDTLANQPLLSGIRKAFGSRNPVEGIMDIIQSTPSGFMPTLFSQIAQLLDNEKRSTYDIKWSGEAMRLVQRKVPGLTEYLEPNLNVFGDPEKYYTDDTNPLAAVFYTFFSPAIVKRYNPSPEAKFVLDLYDQFGDKDTVPTKLNKKIRVEGQDIILTPAELTMLQEYSGKQIQERLSKEMALDTERLSEKVQIKRIDNIYSEVYNDVKEKLRKLRGIPKKKP